MEGGTFAGGFPYLNLLDPPMSGHILVALDHTQGPPAQHLGIVHFCTLCKLDLLLTAVEGVTFAGGFPYLILLDPRVSGQISVALDHTKGPPGQHMGIGHICIL